MKSFLKGVLAFFLLCFIVVGGFVGYEVLQLRAVNKVKEDVVFTIDKGSSAKGVLNALKREKILRNVDVAYFYMRFLSDDSFKAGTYVINDNMSATELIEHMSNEDNIFQETVMVTVIEGSTLKDIANQIAEVTNVDAASLLLYWNDATVLQDYIKDYSFLTGDAAGVNIRYKLEGYLFPDTYEFLTMTTADQVTRKFLDRTQQIYDKYSDLVSGSSLSPHEIFTLASVVQWEANSYEDMQMVAGVFMNRLSGKCNSQTGDKYLQSSVTVCYAADIELSVACELTSTNESSKNDPYNTYYHAGLMPGPICAPGEDAIHAVLTPDTNSYCFFFADASGIHYTNTYAEHQATYN